MPVYFGLENSKNLKVSALLQAKGLNFLRAPPSDIRIFAIPTKVQFMFRTYTRFLPAFMHATQVQYKTDLSIHGYPIQFDMSQGIIQDCPNLAVLARVPIPAATLDWFKEHARFTEEKYKGRSLMVFLTPNREALEKIRTLNPDPTAPAPENVVNPSCLPVITLVAKIISSFCKTHYYPAFQSDEHLEFTGGPLFDDVQTAKKRRKAPIAPVTKKVTRSTATTAPTEDQMDTMDHDDAEEEERPSGAEVKHAVPSPKNISGWGNVADVPHLPGIFFRFEADLCSIDTTTVPDTIQTYFLGCLGRDTHQINQTLATVREKWGVIGRTDSGKVYSHMMKVLALCLEAQARFFPVFDGKVYVGSVMSGAGYRVINQGKVVEPYAHDQLISEVEECGAGKSIFKAIGMLADANDHDEIFWSSGDTGITSMHELSLEMKQWSLTEALRDDIVKLAAKLSFPEDKWPVNPSTISRALELIASPEDLPVTLPVHYSKVFSTDRVALIWSCFGLIAPTTNFRSGKVIRLEGGKIDSTITFTQVGLDEAIADLKRTLQQKTVTVPQNTRRSGPYKDFKFTSVDAQKVWEALRKAAGVKAGDSSAIGMGEVRTEAVDNVLGDWF